MTIPGQPSPSSTLKKALDLLAAGQEKAAEEAVRAAAVQAKSQSGSGSLPLARAYADMARLHFRAGEYKKSATEFRHACEGPMPPDAAGRKDRLAFMFGFAASLDALGKSEEAEKVFRQCIVFARNLHGPSSAGYAAGLEPLARFLLKTGKHPEAAQLMDEAYDALWKLGDRTITAAIPTRAETLKAAGRADNPFADLAHLPDDLVAETVANTVGRAGTGDGPRVRAVLAELLKFLDKKYGDAHPTTADTLAAIAHHEAKMGESGDPKVRANAARRAVWAYTARRVPGGLLTNLEVGFEAGGTIHLVPLLARDPTPTETVQLEAVLTQAVDDLYARPAKKPGA
ncbi:MAG TPA: tetratricopeptide repeat protein [Gemmataceae bacterium]|nr:tetratricopeptide repeat protein [Gemmataceae bacterium]